MIFLKEIKRRHNMQKKIMSVVMFLLLPSVFIKSPVNANTTSVQPNMPVKIKCEQTLSTKNITDGKTIKFSVMENVIDSNGNLVISAGTPVYAQITEIQGKKRIGKSGVIRISNFVVNSTTGTEIPLTGSLESIPANKRVKSIVLSSAICPLFLLMHGADAIIPVGTSTVVFTK